jgi:hypothetical protein
MPVCTVENMRDGVTGTKAKTTGCHGVFETASQPDGLITVPTRQRATKASQCYECDRSTFVGISPLVNARDAFKKLRADDYSAKRLDRLDEAVGDIQAFRFSQLRHRRSSRPARF